MKTFTRAPRLAAMTSAGREIVSPLWIACSSMAVSARRIQCLSLSLFSSPSPGHRRRVQPPGLLALHVLGHWRGVNTRSACRGLRGADSSKGMFFGHTHQCNLWDTSWIKLPPCPVCKVSEHESRTTYNYNIVALSLSLSLSSLSLSLSLSLS